MEEKVYMYLNFLGITSKYCGFNAMTTAIVLMIQDPTYSSQATKRLYPDVATKCGCSSWKTVERNFRTLVDVFWRNPNREDLCRELSIQPFKKPTVMTFLQAVSKKVIYSMR